MAFIIQEAIGVGQWRTVGKPFYKSLPAHGVLGKIKAVEKTKTLRVVHERTVQVVRPPKVAELVSFMWLRKYTMKAIDRAIEYCESIDEMLNQKRAA